MSSAALASELGGANYVTDQLPPFSVLPPSQDLRRLAHTMFEGAFLKQNPKAAAADVGLRGRILVDPAMAKERSAAETEVMGAAAATSDRLSWFLEDEAKVTAPDKAFNSELFLRVKSQLQRAAGGIGAQGSPQGLYR